MILIALGANLPSSAGLPPETLNAALLQLGFRGITIVEHSSFYKSAAWPNASDPAFVNAVARVRTALDPAELLSVLHEIEDSFGRRRSVPNAPRTLDLDLVDYDGRIQKGPPELPHPRAAARLFVLLPLAEIAAEWRHPVSGKGVAELIESAPKMAVERL